MTVSHVTTHVLDTTLGRPAAGLPVVLESAADRSLDRWTSVSAGFTDTDGRIDDFGPAKLPAGIYRMVFDTGVYFAAAGQADFYPEVVVVFRLTEEDSHHHIPLLISPFSYSTYRGN